MLASSSLAESVPDEPRDSRCKYCGATGAEMASNPVCNASDTETHTSEPDRIPDGFFD